jgi:hypothetical protein
MASSSFPLELPELPPSDVAADRATMNLMALESPPPWHIATAFPWRIATWRRAEPAEPADPGFPVFNEPAEPRGGIESAEMLPGLQKVRFEGSIAPGEGIDFYGLEIGPSSRSVSISYQRRPGHHWGGPVRVWLADALGNVINSWTLDPAFAGLDLRMLAFQRPEPTTLYVGIEAAWGSGGGSGATSYALEVLQGGGGEVFPFQFPNTSPAPTSPPLVGDGVAGGFGSGSGFGLGMISPTMIDSGPVVTIGTIDGSGGNSFGLGLLELASTGPISLGPSLSRPLPTQAAASVGGLLPAGPDVRGDSGSPGQVPQIDDLMDPVLLAVEPVLPADSESPATQDSPSLAQSGAQTDGNDEAIEVARSSTTPPSPIRLSSRGGFPLLVAGLRLAWGAPSPSGSTPTLDESPEIPEEADPGSPALPPVPRADSSTTPTRPRVLRTALIGAAALAVGLILPDLATDRPSLRHRRANPLRPWRRSDPLGSSRSDSPGH